MAVAPADPFVWSAGGGRMTPDEIAAQRKVAQAMMAKGADYSPIQSPWQGVARVAQGIFGGLESGRADEAARTNSAAEAQLLSGLLGGGAPPPAASPSVSAPAAATPAAIPEGMANPSLADAISKVAAARGVDPQYMTRLASVESGGNVNAANPNSSARGPFQFINSTAQQYGLTNPNDPAASADAAARLTLDNKQALTQALGREPSPGELYLAHQQGAAGAAKLLANPDVPVEQVIGADAARNNGATPGMTAGQFAQQWIGKFGGQDAALPPNSTPTQGTMPQSAPAAAQGINPRLAAAMASPYVSEGTKRILGVMLQSQMKRQAEASDPYRQLQMREMQGKLDVMPLDADLKRKQLAKSDAPTSVQEYNFYAQQAREAGAKPLSFAEYQTQIKKAGASSVNVNTGENAYQKELGKTTASDVLKQRQEAQDASDLIKIINDGRSALDGGAITGAGANFKIGALKWAGALGFDIPQDAANNSETFRAVMGQAVGKIIKQFGSGTGLSDADRQYAERIAGGSVELNEAAIRRIMDIAEKAARGRISTWEKRVPDVIKGDISSILSVPAPPVYVPPAPPPPPSSPAGQAAPAVGAIMDGHRFKGGNPADPASWERVQ